MADFTRRFRFTILDQPTDRPDLQNYKFSDADRLLLDRLLRFAVENHVHTGETLTTTRPPSAILTVAPTGGSIPGNSAVHYRYSIVDSRGQEAIASQVATVYTPAQAAAPAFAPRLTAQAGTLDGGDYLYAVSACGGETSQETLAGPAGAGTLSGFGSWYVDLPPMPSGGQGFNVYRKGPRDAEMVYLLTTGVDQRSFTDHGDTATNPRRTLPRANTTWMNNTVTVQIPGPLPTGSWTWKLYRTFDPTQWDNSLLDWIGPTDSYTDDGRATRPGFPSETSAAVGGAAKIRLITDTVGTPPAAAATAASRQINFNADLVQVGVGTWRWICEYQRAELQSLWATVNRSNPPTVQGCTFGLDLCWAGQSTWEPIVSAFGSTSPSLSYVFAGNTIGTREPLIGSYAGAYPVLLGPGDALRLHVYQTGYTPDAVDHDLTVTVTMRVHDGLSDQTYQWESS
jgi:hypothetical protein